MSEWQHLSPAALERTNKFLAEWVDGRGIDVERRNYLVDKSDPLWKCARGRVAECVTVEELRQQLDALDWTVYRGRERNERSDYDFILNLFRIEVKSAEPGDRCLIWPLYDYDRLAIAHFDMFVLARVEFDLDGATVRSAAGRVVGFISRMEFQRRCYITDPNAELTLGRLKSEKYPRHRKLGEPIIGVKSGFEPETRFMMIHHLHPRRDLPGYIEQGGTPGIYCPCGEGASLHYKDVVHGCWQHYDALLELWRQENAQMHKRTNAPVHLVKSEGASDGADHLPGLREVEGAGADPTPAELPLQQLRSDPGQGDQAPQGVDDAAGRAPGRAGQEGYLQQPDLFGG